MPVRERVRLGDADSVRLLRRNAQKNDSPPGDSVSNLPPRSTKEGLFVPAAIHLYFNGFVSTAPYGTTERNIFSPKHSFFWPTRMGGQGLRITVISTTFAKRQNGKKAEL